MSRCDGQAWWVRSHPLGAVGSTSLPLSPPLSVFVPSPPPPGARTRKYTSAAITMIATMMPRMNPAPLLVSGSVPPPGVLTLTWPIRGPSSCDFGSFDDVRHRPDLQQPPCQPLSTTRPSARSAPWRTNLQRFPAGFDRYSVAGEPAPSPKAGSARHPNRYIGRIQ